MVVPENKEFARVDNSATAPEEEERSLLLFPDEGLLDRQILTILQNATQSSAEFLEIPICIVGGVQKNQRLRQLASTSETDLEDIEELQNIGKQLPEISRDEAFWQEVLDSHRVVAIRDPVREPKWAESICVEKYGIRAFLGVPLLASRDDRILGVLMAMDLTPRRFSTKEIQFLELTARWTMSELERMGLGISRSSVKRSPQSTAIPQTALNASLLEDPSPDDLGSQGLHPGNSLRDRPSLRVTEQLIASMTQEMRNPLTSVTGMARVLNQEVYGPLNEKQKEYLNIIYDSGRYLVSLLDELVALRTLNEQTPGLEIGSVDIEMLCQQVFNHLELDASRQGQEFRLSVEPGDRLVLLDKSKVYQILYHLLARTIETSHAGGVVHLHVSRTIDCLKMTIWVSHPWLGAAFNPMDMLDLDSDDLLLDDANDEPVSLGLEKAIETLLSGQIDSNAVRVIGHLISGFKSPDSLDSPAKNADEKSSMKLSRQDLGILLSWELTRQHQGKISLEGSSHSGYRYLLELPLISEVAAPD